MANDGRVYESFVASLQSALLKSDALGIQKNITIEKRKVITDNCGIDREFDLYWEYEFGGVVYKTIVECKDYASAVSVEKIDALLGKIKDIPDLKPLFATKVGYQSGAQKKAEQNKIDLLIVRKPDDSDWVDEAGVPLIKSVCISRSISKPAKIKSFNPKVKPEVLQNLGENYELKLSGLNNEIFVGNNEKELSLLDLENKLAEKHKNEFGIFEDSISLGDEGFLRTPMQELKIVGYTIQYEIEKPEEESFVVDASDAMYGVIEYLGKNRKNLFWKDGKIERRFLNKKDSDNANQ